MKRFSWGLYLLLSLIILGCEEKDPDPSEVDLLVDQEKSADQDAFSLNEDMIADENQPFPQERLILEEILVDPPEGTSNFR